MSCNETITIPKSEYRALLYASARSRALNDYIRSRKDDVYIETAPLKAVAGLDGENDDWKRIGEFLDDFCVNAQNLRIEVLIREVG